MKRKLKIFLAVLAGLMVVWFIVNPIGRFGFCIFGFTAYNALPIPVADIEVRADGSMRRIPKTHQLSLEKLDWLMESPGEVLIIAIGWDGIVVPDERIKNISGPEVRILKNGEAIRLFNQCKKDGKRVSIHYHSTC